MRLLNIEVRAILRRVDGGQESEDRERPAVIQVAMKSLQVGLWETLGQRPVRIQGRERGRALEVAVASIVLVVRHAGDRGGLSLRAAGVVTDHERLGTEMGRHLRGLPGAQ